MAYTPLHDAAYRGDVDKARELLKQGRYDVNCRYGIGWTPLHCACTGDHVDMVRMLISEFQADTTLQDACGDTPLHKAAYWGRGEVALTLITGFGCDANILNNRACQERDGSVVRIIGKYASVLATDKDGDTPLHIAAARGHKECVEALLQLDAPIMLRNAAGKTALHLALERGRSSIVRIFIKHVSLFATTKDGDTPLHIAAAGGHDKCVEALLQLDAPIMLRNAAGKTARDIACYDAEQLLDAYITQNKAKLYAHYDIIMQQAKKKYSNAERITRVSVIGYPGAGKSSFVEAMKREGFFKSFGRVSESAVPPHTAGIIPSIYTSKHYGRVLFYDFAGDPEYYSSHAAILENLASSKGDNIFIIVVNLKDDILTVRNTLHYWLSFIEYQYGSKNLITLGSHSDLLPKETADKTIQKISAIYSEEVDMDYFTLNCCKPRSKEFEDIKSKIVQVTKDSPRYKLSIEASVLLALLEKDFRNVTACSVRTILSSIVDTGISLPKNITSLMPLMRALHDVGILFVIGDERGDIPQAQVILNISKLTNEVHKLLFSKEAVFLEAISSFNIGILPQSLLENLLPQHITKECLVQLQYCQEIFQQDLGYFPSLTQPDSSSQSFHFFPAFCTVGKSDVSWVTPPGLSYSIGWLARCTNSSCDYFPPRFLHVLLLRLVFRFTLTVHARHQTDTRASPEHTHLKRGCTMWNCGVHWFMEEGVECMVELVNGNKGVAVITNSEENNKENGIGVFHSIISCVMEAKAEFCHSIRPHFFLFDPSQSADYLHDDNLCSMNDVERVLASSDGKIVLSITRQPRLKRERIACLSRFTLWNSLFSLDFTSVHHYLKDVVNEMYGLFIRLGLPKTLLDTLEANFLNDLERRRIELVAAWISSSSPDPPCWWRLVLALKEVKYGRLAQELETQYSKCSVVYSCTNIHSVYSQNSSV